MTWTPALPLWLACPRPRGPCDRLSHFARDGPVCSCRPCAVTDGIPFPAHLSVPSASCWSLSSLSRWLPVQRREDRVRSGFASRLCRHQAQCGFGQVASPSFRFPSCMNNVARLPVLVWAPELRDPGGARPGGRLTRAAFAGTAERPRRPPRRLRGASWSLSQCPRGLSHPLPRATPSEARRGAGPSLLLQTDFSGHLFVFSLQPRSWARWSFKPLPTRAGCLASGAIRYDWLV